MKKIIDWFKESNRWKHLIGGIVIGIGANDWYCAAYAGAGVGAGMEFKDRQWGGKWDWVDLGLTFAGSMIGHGIQELIY
jgi:hypothetical protein